MSAKVVEIHAGANLKPPAQADLGAPLPLAVKAAALYRQDPRTKVSAVMPSVTPRSRPARGIDFSLTEVIRLDPEANVAGLPEIENLQAKKTGLRALQPVGGGGTPAPCPRCADHTSQGSTSMDRNALADLLAVPNLTTRTIRMNSSTRLEFSAVASVLAVGEGTTLEVEPLVHGTGIRAIHFRPAGNAEPRIGAVLGSKGRLQLTVAAKNTIEATLNAALPELTFAALAPTASGGAVLIPQDQLIQLLTTTH